MKWWRIKILSGSFFFWSHSSTMPTHHGSILAPHRGRIKENYTNSNTSVFLKAPLNGYESTTMSRLTCASEPRDSLFDISRFKSSRHAITSLSHLRTTSALSITRTTWNAKEHLRHSLGSQPPRVTRLNFNHAAICLSVCLSWSAPAERQELGAIDVRGTGVSSLSGFTQPRQRQHFYPSKHVRVTHTASRRDDMILEPLYRWPIMCSHVVKYWFTSAVQKPGSMRVLISNKLCSACISISNSWSANNLFHKNNHLCV